MKIQFVEHASISISTHNVMILSDPWYSGKVFNDGWALLSKPVPPPLHAVTHIWISHEHPDHLHFPTLKDIPEADKQRVVILHQRHASPRVVDSIRKLGFQRIVELPLYAWYQLTPDVRLFCGSAGRMDSFLVVRDDEETVLNMNDCVLNPAQLRYVKSRIGKVTALFTQFSFATWVGNDHDEAQGGPRKIQQMRDQIAIFHPEVTVPTASFVYFCNQENARMNAWVNTPDKIANLGLPGLNVMYPGDVWDSNMRRFESTRALDRWRVDYANMAIDPKPPIVELAKIDDAVQRRLTEMKSKVPQALMQRAPMFDIFIHDLNQVLEVNPATNSYRIYEATPASQQQTRYTMCSQVAWYTFSFPWGGDTATISGMFLDRGFAKYKNNLFFRLQNLVSTEAFRTGSVAATMRTAQFWWRKKWEMVYRFTGKRKDDELDDE